MSEPIKTGGKEWARNILARHEQGQVVDDLALRWAFEVLGLIPAAKKTQ